jgi:hypothetical protein
MTTKSALICAGLTACILAAGIADATQPSDPVPTDNVGNTAMGYLALYNLTTGADNTATGEGALSGLTTAYYNTAYGNFALSSNNGNQNAAFGDDALENNTSGYDNAAVGYQALLSNETGYYNMAFGSQALYSNSSGHQNAAIGHQALYSNTTGSNNVATGANSLRSNTTGGSNIGIGVATLQNTTVGQNNLAIGANALTRNVSGSSNTAIGANAGLNISGKNNIDISNQGQSSDVGVIRIGDIQTETFVAGIAGKKVTGAAVYITANGQLGTLASSERYKVGIKPMAAASDKINELRPVTYRLKTDPHGALQYGLIAEEVAKVYPDLVFRNAEGSIEGVRYEELTPILLNDAQQARKELLSLTDRVEMLDKRLAELTHALERRT